MGVVRDQLLNPGHDLIEALLCFEIREDERQVPAHPSAISIHNVEIRADMRRQIDLIDHEQIGTSNSRPALARNLITGCHIDHVNDCVREFRTECRSQIVAAALDEHQLDIGMALEQIVQGLLIVRGIFTDRRMRTASGFDAQNAVLRQRAPVWSETQHLLS